MNRFLLATILLLTSLCVFSQNSFTKEQVLNMTEDQLMDLSMEDFSAAIRAAGVSNPDELFAMIMNKNVSSASKADESTFDSPLSTSVITHDEIRRFGCISIEEALRLVPGAIVYEKSNGVYDVHLRGLSNIPENNFLFNSDNCNTLMMIDGRQVFNYSIGTTFWESLPIGIDDIDRIEIVRGPASALYGANAVTGVINIITFKGNTSQKSVVGNISYGNKNTATADVSLRKSFAKNKLFIGASVNMQSRERGTDKIYVAPRKGLYIINDFMAIQKGDDLTYGLGYDLLTQTAVDNTPDLMESDATYRPIRKSRLQIPYEDLRTMIDKGYMTDMSKGGYVTLDQLNALRYIEYNATQSNFIKMTNAQLAAIGITGTIPDSLFASYNGLSDYVDAESLYPDSRMSRENIGANGYIRFNPNNNVDVSFTIGYQDSKAFTSAYRDDYYAMSQRSERSTYSNILASIYGFNLQASLWDGKQNYCVGFPGYEMDFKQFAAQADYEFNLIKNSTNQSLKLRPGLSLMQYKLSDDDYIHYAPNGNRITGYLNGSTKLRTQAAMVRFDYRVYNLRLIGAYRAEKMNIPDDWNHTWQLGATYSINDNNCLRVVYGRANRSSFAINSSSNYDYDRTGMALPAFMTFLANEDADVMKLDNIEIGFRSRPTPRMLIDLEAFYSTSKDYGALISDKSQYEADIEGIKAVVANGISQANSSNIAKSMFDLLKTRSYMQYQNDSSKPKQIGISVGLDWIATDKLIIKMNANVQKTTIDDYAEYSQPAAIRNQLTVAASKAANLQKNMTATMSADPSITPMKYLIDMAYDIPEKYYRRGDDGEVIGIRLEDLKRDGINIDDLKKKAENEYGFSISDDISTAILGSSKDRPSWKKEDGHKSKATPSFYGSLGLIYKPIERLSIAANANFMTERQYRVKGGTECENHHVNGMFLMNAKLGYQPIKGLEVYVNARNLFNNKTQQFVYCDKIGGIYSIGASFEF